MSNNYKGAILVTLSSLGFGIMTIFAKLAYSGGISVATLLFIRFLLASAIFFVYVFISTKKIHITMGQLGVLFILGLFYTFQSNFYFSSVKYISPSLAALLLYIYPVFVSFLSLVFDKEKLSLKRMISIAVSFAGLVLILGTSFEQMDMRGVLFALGAAFVYSLYIVLGNRITQQLPSLVISAFVTLFAACGLLTVGIVTQTINFEFDPAVWLVIAGIILFSTIMAIFTFFRGLEYLGSTRASIISMTEPFFTVIFSFILFHDKLNMFQFIGGGAVLTGAGLAILSKSRKQDATVGQ